MKHLFLAFVGIILPSFVLATPNVPSDEARDYVNSTSIGDISRHWIQNGCTLYRLKQEPKIFPGEYCIFLDDGSFISANGHSMKRISPKLEVLWEVSDHFHHQVNLSPDGKRILALKEHVNRRNGTPYRDDDLAIYDLDGKLLQSKSVLELLKAASPATD